MPALGGVTRQDVDELSQLARDLRRISGVMGQAVRPMDRLVSAVQAQIGGTATGQDKAFIELLVNARQEFQGAVSGCLNASAGATQAASQAADELREQERLEREQLRRV